MALTKQDVREVLATYIKAWQAQDPDLIVTTFTESATYHEQVLGAPMCRVRSNMPKTSARRRRVRVHPGLGHPAPGRVAFIA